MVKPTEHEFHILVLSYSKPPAAETAKAWYDALPDGIFSTHCDFFLSTGQRARFFGTARLAVFTGFEFFTHSDRRFSRSEHVHTLSAVSTTRQQTGFTVAAWFAEQAASRRVPFLFLSPEDFGGNSSHGPASPWSLVEFRCLNGINDVWRGAPFMCRFANTEQRHPTGILTNIQGLLRSLVIGWPNLKSIDGELVYLGPLPRVCPCTQTPRIPWYRFWFVQLFHVSHNGLFFLAPYFL